MADPLTSLLGFGGLAASAYLPYENSGSQIDYLKNQIPSYVTQAGDITDAAVAAAQFSPFTVKTATGGTANVGAGGSLTQSLSTGEQDIMSGLLGQAQTGINALGSYPDTSMLQEGAFGGAGTALQGATQANPYLTGNLDALQALQAGQLGQYGLAGNTLSGINQTALQGAEAGLTAQTPTAESLFSQITAMQSPEQERQRLQLENRLAAQGRLGVQTAAYGGTPEQLALAKAQEEARNSAAFQATQMADQLASSQQARATGLAGLGLQGTQAQQALNSNDLSNIMNLQQGALGNISAQQALQQGSASLGSSLFGLGASAASLPSTLQAQQLGNIGTMLGTAYTPQQQQLAALGAASPFSQLATSAALSQAEQLSAGGQYGLEALAAGNQSIAGLESARVQALANSLQGLFSATGQATTSPFESLVAALSG